MEYGLRLITTKLANCFWVLILVVMEYGLRLAYLHSKKEFVLILVVMEYGLGFNFKNPLHLHNHVLILVVVEYGLGYSLNRAGNTLRS